MTAHDGDLRIDAGAAITLDIRELRSGDIGALQRIDRAVHGTAWSDRVFRDDIERADRLHLVGVGPDGAVFGHAAAWRDGRTGRITNVAVRRADLGLGYGSQLLIALLEAMRVWPDMVSIALEVRADNVGAQRLYRRFGFAPVGVERGFYPGVDGAPAADALVMRHDEPHSASPRRAPCRRTGSGEVGDHAGTVEGASA